MICQTLIRIAATFILFVLLAATFLPLSAQTIRRVTTAGDTGADGSSWSNAMTLQAALAASDSLDQVWIAGGTYKPHATDRDTTFSVSAGVLVYGGFDPVADATDTDANSRSGTATILSGDLMNDDIERPVAGADQTAYDTTRDDNSYTVVTVSGADVTLDGLTISGGERGTEVEDNSGNTEYYGAGLYGGFGTGVLTLLNVILRSNNAEHDGGGACFKSVVSVTNSAFTNNTATKDGGGAYFVQTATLTGCDFNNNNSDRWGGGASFRGTATVTNCTFTENTANGVLSEGGGAVFCEIATVTQCTFTDNETKNNGGAAVFREAGTVINSTLYNNMATGDGGGIYANFGLTTSGSNTNNFNLRNSILMGNTAADAASGHQVYVNAADEVNVQHNLITGGADSVGTDQGIVYGTVPGFSNITEAGTVDESDATVVFASTTIGEANYLRLRAGSPAVNAGNNTYIPSGITTDAAGNARIQDGTVDLGAYESVSSVDAGTVALGIEDAVDDLVLYPNPTSGKLHFSEQVEEFLLYSSEGRLLDAWKNVRSADLTALPSGMYFVEVIRGGRSVGYRIVRK